MGARFLRLTSTSTWCDVKFYYLFVAAPRHDDDDDNDGSPESVFGSI